MALRLRRGTDAERLLITPAEGELLYITDTKELWVGDGATVGGIKVIGSGEGPGSIEDLDNVTIGTLNNNDILAYNASTGQWEPTQAAAPELVESGAYRFDIIGDDSSTVVDHVNANHYGSFYGGVFDNSGTQLLDPLAKTLNNADGTPLIQLETGEMSGLFHGIILGDDSSVMLNSNSNTINAGIITASDSFRGNVLGDLSGDSAGTHTGPVIGNVTGNVVGNLSGDVNGEVTGNVVGNVTGDVVGNLTGTVTGNLTGIVFGETVGNHTGNVFGEDSTVLLNATTRRLEGDVEGNVIGNLTGDSAGTHTGPVIGNTTGTHFGDVQGNVIGDLQGDTFGIHRGHIEGTFEGDVVRDDSTVVVDANGDISANYLTFETLTSEVNSISDIIDFYGNPTGSTSTDRSVSLSIQQERGSAAINIKTVGNSSFSSTGRIRFNTVHAAEGDIVNPVNPVAGDYQGGFSVSSYDPTFGDYVASSYYVNQVDNQETPSNDYVPGKHVFGTNDGTGSSPSIKLMTFDSSGRLAVNQQDANADCTLDVNGIARLAPQTGAPATLVEGMIAVADGTTWDPAGKAGAVSYPVYYDGNAWQAFY